MHGTNDFRDQTLVTTIRTFNAKIVKEADDVPISRLVVMSRIVEETKNTGFVVLAKNP